MKTIITLLVVSFLVLVGCGDHTYYQVPSNTIVTVSGDEVTIIYPNGDREVIQITTTPINVECVFDAPKKEPKEPKGPKDKDADES